VPDRKYSLAPGHTAPGVGIARGRQHADVSDNALFQGDLPAALGAMRARTYLMPCTSDRYFTAPAPSPPHPPSIATSRRPPPPPLTPPP
jgi:hypothetical protein